MKSPPRVLLADDHAIVTAGLRSILEPDFEVVAEVRDGRALVTAAERLRPDIIVADISMPLLNGVEAAFQIRKTNRKVKIVFLTMHSDVTFASEALRAGGSAYVLKSAAGAEILEAIREALSGRIFVTQSIDRDVVLAQMQRASFRTGIHSELTPRQREVLQLLAEGKSLKEVSAILHISIKTAEFHKYRIMAQLGLRSSAEITKYGLKQGMTSL